MSANKSTTISLAAAVTSACKPGARGSRQCWCIGNILEILGHYGWILPFDDLDNVAAQKTAGRVYFDKEDVAKGVKVAKGDTVGFYLYIDDMGFGAEGLRRLEKSSSDSFNAGAQKFVSSAALVTKPVPSLWYKKESASYKGKFYYVNSKTHETSWKVPEDYSEAATEVSSDTTETAACLQNQFLAYLSDDSSDEESDCEQTHTFAIDKAASKRSLSPETSTTAGLSSDSESDDTFMQNLPEACLGHQKFRPPPGLSLPSNPCSLAVGILSRAGLSANQDQQHQHQQQQQQQKWIPRWRLQNKEMTIQARGRA